MRLDDLLVNRKLADSKNQAQALIMAGKVWSGTQRMDKPGKKVAEDIELRVEAPPKYVSRGGEKLEAAISAAKINIQERLCLDVGASTGGFTDCLLQYGAREVVAIDVGHGQMHSKIKNDPRVKAFEGINARTMSPDDIPYASYDIVVMDLAFISQKKVLENIWGFVKPDGYFISLIKPQFEVSKQEADKCQGVIKDEAIRARVIAEIRAFAAEKLINSSELAFLNSPITGSEGNVEYLIIWQRRA
jgi:23S rRNA (cytidine1920-2'-O)/16S rRNA (cytidine1409-2'-O)-methyltransferase